MGNCSGGGGGCHGAIKAIAQKLQEENSALSEQVLALQEENDRLRSSLEAYMQAFRST